MSDGEEDEFRSAARDLLDSVVTAAGGASRAGQEQMVEEVAQAFEDTEHLIVQAGTGTGKSIGYLVPSLLWSAREGKRVIVSTATLALQRQIVLHDGPLVAEAVAKATGVHPVLAVLKGWNNYVCLRKASGGYPEDGALFSQAEAKYGASATGEEVVRAREWAMATDTGDRDDLVPGVSDRAWAQVSVPKRECVGERCPLRASCFPALARIEAGEAGLVVTNHSLLGVESGGTPVLPEADAFVIDEAHALPERVTSQLTLSLDPREIRSLARLLRRTGLEDQDLDASADDLEDALAALPDERILALPEELTGALLVTLGRVHAAQDSLMEFSPKGEELAVSKQILKARLAELDVTCVQALSAEIEDGELVAWKGTVGDEHPRLYLAPLDVAGAIADHLFEEKPVILTSATAKLGGSFDPIASRVGLAYPSQGPWRGVDVGTPFDHAHQGILYVASHLPVPGREGYSDEALEEIRELVEASGGGALGLFTSRAGAERATEYMRTHSSYRILAQGEDQLPTLVDEFTRDDAASLFGTMALWQGIDVPGRTCRLVIIDRIPFPRPNEPITQARSEAATKRRTNAFMEVSATQAALLLAQGAGRLLRRIDDRGVVAVLDPRLRTARYASFLLASLPDMWRTTDQGVVLEALERLREL